MARRTRDAPARRRFASRGRWEIAGPRVGMAERGKEPVLDGMGKRWETSPPRYTSPRSCGPQDRTSGRLPAGLRGSPLRATQTSSGPAATAWGWPGTGRVRVTPSVVVFSPESPVATANAEPTTAAIAVAETTAIRKHPCPRGAPRRRGCVHGSHHPTSGRECREGNEDSRKSPRGGLRYEPVRFKEPPRAVSASRRGPL